MHGSTIRVPDFAPRARCPIRRYQDSRIRETAHEDGVQDDQGHHDIETDLAFRSLGNLVLLLQVSEIANIVLSVAHHLHIPQRHMVDLLGNILQRTSSCLIVAHLAILLHHRLLRTRLCS